jgi:hypothetical protein
MTDLRLEYLRDTGKQPVEDTLSELWYHDKISKKAYDEISAYSEYFHEYTEEYVEWLENKINNNLKQ